MAKGVLVRIATYPDEGRAASRIWRLQYGPCWCRSTPGDTGTFDFLRFKTHSLDLGDARQDFLIVSDRVIDGSRPMFVDIFGRVPEPRVTISTAACPAAADFWSELPMGWTPVSEVLPVDIHVSQCVTRYPEALLAAVLEHVLTSDASEPRFERATASPRPYAVSARLDAI